MNQFGRGRYQVYLMQIPSCDEDIEAFKDNFEICLTCDDMSFCLHQLMTWFQEECGDASGMPKGPWISVTDFHHEYYLKKREKNAGALSIL